MPEASICIPTYNSARFLGGAIDSALAQTFTDFEVIVSDNASTDETPSLCRHYNDPRFRYHRFETLIGQGGNWNRCISLATGKFVALLHADDTYLPDFLAVRMEQFAAAPGAGIAFGAVELIDEGGRRIGSQSFGDREVVVQPPNFYGDLLMGCIINPASLVVRRSCYAAVGMFNEQRLWGIDWEMWLRLSEIGGVSYTPRVSSQYRIHGASGSSTGLLGPRYLAEDLSVLNSALGRLNQDPRLEAIRPKQRQALQSYGLRAMSAAGANCEAGHRLGTLRALWEALRYHPSLATRPTVWALAAGVLVGPCSYRAWKRIRGAKTAT